MKIITAIGNQTLNQKVKFINNLYYSDIQYQEAVISILEKEKETDLLILSSLLPGELSMEEFINVITYNNPELEIIVILDERNERLKKYLIAKGIKKIYYNNENTYEEIIDNIINKNKKNTKENTRKKQISKNIKKIIKKIINKIIKIKKYKNNNKKIKKIYFIFGDYKIGKSIFIILISLLLKNKKILIINNQKNYKNFNVIIGNKNCQKNIIIKWKNWIDILFLNFDDKNQIDNNYYKKSDAIFSKIEKNYDYIFIEMDEAKNISYFRKIFQEKTKTILLVEPNLLGINEAKEILLELVKVTKEQKDNVIIVYNKSNSTSISQEVLRLMFKDFKNIGTIQYDKNYNLFLNSNTKIITKNIKKQYNQIAKHI